MIGHETAGVELVPAKRKNLPLRILRAFDNAKHLVGLKRGVKDTLAELCRFVPQNQPFDTIFAHKATIAARIGASERTIYRHLEILQEQRLIEVLEQDRKSLNGRFAVSRIRLTRKAAALLGFIESDADEEIACLDLAKMSMQTTASPTAADVAPVTIETKAVEEKTAALVHSAPSDKMSSGHTLSVPTISKSQPQRVKNGLPMDLTWLTGNGVSRAGIFALMRKAKQHGKRLSDIVLVVLDYIRTLKGGRLFAYLSKLACGPTCFAVAAATERQRVVSQAEARLMERKIVAFKTRFAGATLTNRQQSRLYQIDRSANYAQVFGGAYPVSVPLNDLREWVQRVESGELVLATLETERRFQA